MLDVRCRILSRGKVVLALLIVGPLLPTGCGTTNTAEAPPIATVSPQEQAIRSNPGISSQEYHRRKRNK
jgi:hypothetical protein